jgi:hypothetical protein
VLCRPSRKSAPKPLFPKADWPRPRASVGPARSPLPHAICRARTGPPAGPRDSE